MSGCCMGRQDVRFESQPNLITTSSLALRRVACRLGSRFMARCRDVPRHWTGAWSALAAVAGGGFALSASLSLPVAAPGLATESALAWAGAVILPVVTAAASGFMLPRLIGHADRRAILWLLGGLMVATDLAAALVPDMPLFLAARALFGVALGGFWSLAAGLGGRLTASGSAARARALLAGSGVAGGLVGALALSISGHAVASIMPGADQILADRLAYGGGAVLGLAALAAQMAWLPHLPDNGTVRRYNRISQLQAAE